MQTAGRVSACSFACYSLVQVGAGGRRGSCCAHKGVQTREAGEKGGGCKFNLGVLLSRELGGRRGKGVGWGGTFLCPLHKQGGHAPTFCSPVLFSREGLKRGKRWGGGGAPSEHPTCFILESRLRILFSKEWGLGAKGGGMPVQCELRFDE